MSRIVLRNFCLHTHPFHLDFIDFQYAGIPFFQPFFEQGKQFVGILFPFFQQTLLFIQHYKIQAEILCIQQYIATGSLILTVKGFTLQLSRTAACRIQGGKIESLCHDQFRTRHTGNTFGIKRTIFYRRIFQVILRLDFQLCSSCSMLL